MQKRAKNAQGFDMGVENYIDPKEKVEAIKKMMGDIVKVLKKGNYTIDDDKELIVIINEQKNQYFALNIDETFKLLYDNFRFE